MTLGNLNPFGQFRPMMMLDGGAGLGAGNDGSTDDGNAGDGKADDGNSGAAASGEHFYDGFSDEVRNHPSVAKFKSSEDMAKSYVSLEKKIGAKGVIVPGEGAKPEDINAYQIALGRPENAEGYRFDTPEGLHKNIQITPELENGFKDVALKLGLTNEQAAGLRMYQLDSLTAQINTSEKTRGDNLLNAQTELRKEYGGKYDETVGTALKVVDKFGGADVKALLNETGLGNNPAVIKMMAKIGSSLSEDSIGKIGGGNPLMSPAQAKAEVAKINMAAQADSKHPLMDETHPEHKEAISKRDSLYKLAYPEA